MADYGGVQEFDRKHQLARNKRDILRPLIEDCYRHVLPLQERKPSANKLNDEQPNFTELYDATAAAAAQDLASEMLDDAWPSDATPFTLALGKHAKVDSGERKRVNNELEARADILIEEINNSGDNEGEGWFAAAHEAMLDWTIAQGTIARHIDPGPNSVICFEALPLPTICTLRGPYGATECLFRTARKRRSDILAAWPMASGIPAHWRGPNLGTGKAAYVSDDIEEEVVEGIWRDRGADARRTGVERWVTQVRVTGLSDFIHTAVDEGIGSKPFIDFAYMRASGETLGRGPGMLAMPDVRVLNKIKEMHLELLDLQLWGIWGFEDSSMNVENLPPLSPRLVVPFEPGTKGLQRIDGSPNANAIEHVVAALQSNIKDILYGLDLGPTDRTPRSATEVMARTSTRARRRAGPNSRLLNGLIRQTVKVVNWTMEKKGLLSPIRLDGKQVAIQLLSPITRSQQLDDVLRFDRFCEILATRFGPQGLIAAVGLDQAAPWLQEKIGVDARMVRTQAEIRAAQQMLIQAAAAQAGQAPKTPTERSAISAGTPPPSPRMAA